MNNETIQEELRSHVLDLINDEILTLENRDDWQHIAFNEDYYIIGYYNASEWIKKHDIDIFDLIEEVQEYEKDHFGETTISINSESQVNMFVYIKGEEIISDLYELETLEEIKTELCEE